MSTLVVKVKKDDLITIGDATIHIKATGTQPKLVIKADKSIPVVHIKGATHGLGR